MRPDACNGSTLPWSDANAATETSPQSDWRSAGQPRPSATRGVVSPPHSAGCEATGGLEGRQTVLVFYREQTFVKGLYRNRPCPQDGQRGQGPHGEGEVAIPPGPTPDFIVLQAPLALGGFEALCNDPTGPRHAPHLVHFQ
jgi:hypothetical protein